jgi:hypothetical protein
VPKPSFIASAEHASGPFSDGPKRLGFTGERALTSRIRIEAPGDLKTAAGGLPIGSSK